MQEVLFDPQTSGGLLISVNSKDSKSLVEEIAKSRYRCSHCGQGDKFK